MGLTLRTKVPQIPGATTKSVPANVHRISSPKAEDKEIFLHPISIRRGQRLNQPTICAPICELVEAKGLMYFRGFVTKEELVHSKRTVPSKYFPLQNLHRDYLYALGLN